MVYLMPDPVGRRCTMMCFVPCGICQSPVISTGKEIYDALNNPPTDRDIYFYYAKEKP